MIKSRIGPAVQKSYIVINKIAATQVDCFRTHFFLVFFRYFWRCVFFVPCRGSTLFHKETKTKQQRNSIGNECPSINVLYSVWKTILKRKSAVNDSVITKKKNKFVRSCPKASRKHGFSIRFSCFTFRLIASAVVRV